MMEHDAFAGIFSLIVMLISAALFVVPTVMILRKAGYSGWWVLISFIPFVNLIMLWVFALSRWPIEEQLRGGA